MKVIALLGAVILLTLSSSAYADKLPSFDPLNTDVFEFCDLHDHAPISDRCIGFVSAVVEMMIGEDIAKPPSEKKQFCLRSKIDMKSIVEAIRPQLRSFDRICLGFCTSAGYVQRSLREAFPCGRKLL